MSKEVLEPATLGNYWFLLEAKLGKSFSDVVGIREGGKRVKRSTLGGDERDAEAVVVGVRIKGGFEAGSGGPLQS